jgi:hypothetical protein
LRRNTRLLFPESGMKLESDFWIGGIGAAGLDLPAVGDSIEFMPKGKGEREEDGDGQKKRP